MTQERIIREGYYECPKCGGIFEIRKPNPERGDGYCDSCTDDEECSTPLKYLGKEPPKEE